MNISITNTSFHPALTVATATSCCGWMCLTHTVSWGECERSCLRHECEVCVKKRSGCVWLGMQPQSVCVCLCVCLLYTHTNTDTFLPNALGLTQQRGTNKCVTIWRDSYHPPSSSAPSPSPPAILTHFISVLLPPLCQHSRLRWWKK